MRLVMLTANVKDGELSLRYVKRDQDVLLLLFSDDAEIPARMNYMPVSIRFPFKLLMCVPYYMLLHASPADV